MNSIEHPQQSCHKSIAVLIHGQPGSASDFIDIQGRFPSEIKTVAIDRPGWGNSDRDATSLKENARVLMETIDGAEYDRVVLVGYSYGAAVALRAACDFGRKISGMVLVAPVGGVGSLSLLDSFLCWIAKAFRKVAMLVTLSDKFQSRFRTLLSFQLEQSLLKRDLVDLWNQVDKIDLPVRLLVGEDDFLNPLGGTLALCDRLSHCEMNLIKGAGHLLLDQAPEQIIASVLQLAGGFE